MFKLSFLDFFNRRKEETAPISQDKLVLRMNRLLASEDRVPLRELLQVMEVCFDNAVLSVVYGNERSILATTGSRDEVVDIENVAYRIKDTENKEYYLRSEVNGLYFRKGMHCIRVFPFSRVVNVPCFLLVEQESVTKGDMNIDRAIDFLSIAVRLLVLTKSGNEKKRKGGELLSRDTFLECLRTADSECERYLGVFHFANMREMNVKVGMNGVDDIINGISSTLQKEFPDAVCRISTSKFAVILSGEMYYAVCAFQDVLDAITDVFPKANIKCVTTVVEEDIYRIMYLCEKVSETTKGDAVVVIREGNADFEEESLKEDSMEETVYYQTDAEEVVEDIAYHEIEPGKEQMVEFQKEYEKKKKEKEAVNTSEKVSGSEMASNIYDYDNYFDYSNSFAE